MHDKHTKNEMMTVVRVLICEARNRKMAILANSISHYLTKISLLISFLQTHLINPVRILSVAIVIISRKFLQDLSRKIWLI